MTIVQIFKAMGATLSIYDDVALCNAVSNRKVYPVAYLFDNGADINELNKGPLRSVNQIKDTEVVDLLISRSA